MSFNLGTLNVRDIRRSAFLIHRKIERILAQTPSQQIDIIGHSMGGLIGLYYVKKLGGHARVRKLIMMGTPVRGTWAALAGVVTLGLWSTSSWQLLPRSRFLDELAQGPMPPGVEVHTIAAARDWVVPLPTTRLAGATRDDRAARPLEPGGVGRGLPPCRDDAPATARNRQATKRRPPIDPAVCLRRVALEH